MYMFKHFLVEGRFVSFLMFGFEKSANIIRVVVSYVVDYLIPAWGMFFVKNYCSANKRKNRKIECSAFVGKIACRKIFRNIPSSLRSPSRVL